MMASVLLGRAWRKVGTLPAVVIFLLATQYGRIKNAWHVGRREADHGAWHLQEC